MDIIELPICQQKWLDIGNSMHPNSNIKHSYIFIYSKCSTFLKNFWKFLKFSLSYFKIFLKIFENFRRILKNILQIYYKFSKVFKSFCWVKFRLGVPFQTEILATLLLCTVLYIKIIQFFVLLIIIIIINNNNNNLAV